MAQNWANMHGPVLAILIIAPTLYFLCICKLTVQNTSQGSLLGEIRSCLDRHVQPSDYGFVMLYYLAAIGLPSRCSCAPSGSTSPSLPESYNPFSTIIRYIFG